MDPFGGCFRGKRVLVTGHTGFKGSWLCEWLLALGADVYGFALRPCTTPALFDQLELSTRISSEISDLRDATAIRETVARCQPAFVFHLAAQSLVRVSYEEPADTYAVNVMGVVNLLEALRHLQHSCAAIFVTSDKCYENDQQGRSFREDDPLGGFDPYSSSKAAAEIAIASWRRAFFRDHPVKIASARAGNVVGGGDWARDRIVPDCIRALLSTGVIRVRNPRASRPWQHVLEPLSGYLWLAALLSRGATPALMSAFNFGPPEGGQRSVAVLVDEILKNWPGRWEDMSAPNALYEAMSLELSIEKARALLGWAPVWDFPTTIAETIRWYREPTGKRELTYGQIRAYSAAAQALPWAGASGRLVAGRANA